MYLIKYNYDWNDQNINFKYFKTKYRIILNFYYKFNEF